MENKHDLIIAIERDDYATIENLFKSGKNKYDHSILSSIRSKIY